jgi:hypothetical protein
MPARSTVIDNRTRTNNSVLCAEKNRLLGEFLNAIRAFNELQSQQTQAVIDAAMDGDSDFTRFDVLLHMAQDRKEHAKYAWIAHVEEHGCHERSNDRCDSHDWRERESLTAG